MSTYCPQCEGTEYARERRPNGNTTCLNTFCGYVGKSTEWKESIKGELEKMIEQRTEPKPWPTESELEDLILTWQHSWMDVNGTDEKDRKNYFNRASGIDANMRYGLAKKILEYITKHAAPIGVGLSDGEIETKAQEWLRKNDWDYSKYGDRREDRSAYKTMMNYEVSMELAAAYEAGYKAAQTASIPRATIDEMV